MATFVSIDLDDLACYHAIHGLSAKAEVGVILERCLPRFVEWMAEHKSRGTIFVIGRTLEADMEREGKGAANLAAAAQAGHELANHSFAHDYDMVDWPAEKIAEDLHRCDTLLRRVAPEAPKPAGFRAPGYTHDKTMLAQVAALGYRYDSSRLPSPAYYLAKRGVMAWMRVRGRQSNSHRGGATSFIGETAPHLMPELGIWEVPISVSRLFRLPLIGTFLLGGPKRIAQALLQEAIHRRDLVLELHGLDFADPERDPIDPSLVAAEPVLRTPWPERKRRLDKLLEARGGSGTIRNGLPRAGWGASEAQ